MRYTDNVSAYEIYVNEFYVNFTRGDLNCARSLHYVFVKAI